MNRHPSILLALLSPLPATAVACAPDCPPEQVAVHDQRHTRTLCVAKLDSGTTDDSSTGTSSTTDTTDSTTQAPPACGDGLVQPGEECDDANLDDTDACTHTCKNATCGDGLVWAGMEECDDANRDDSDACIACKNATCGDGFLQTGAEECDDANQTGTDACTSTCQNALCGDGIVWAGMEECDDANQVDTDDCSNTCKKPLCGDGQVAGSEECDDGNQDDADACTSTCKAATCGDGFLWEGKEDCDDGNRMDGDGCASCTDEFLMFATEAVYNGDFGDTIEADFLCQSAAEDAALPGIYAAWISTSQHEVMKYLPFEKPLVRTDGEPIVPHAYELAFGSLIYPISRNEYGLPVDGYAWTGTNSKGNPSNQDCNKWTSPFAFATVGQVSAPDEAWTQTPIFGPWNDCDALNHLYCFRRQ